MSFSKNRSSPEPEIKLIPFIDVLLVVLIFLMLTTTWSRWTEINLTLLMADAPKQKDQAQQMVLSINAQEAYALNQSPLNGNTIEALVAVLNMVTPKETILMISDAQASHPSVVYGMEAARRTGLSQISFATQSSGASGS